MSALGRALEERGAYNDAVAVLNDTVRIQSKRPTDIGDLADSLNELAEVQYYLGHYDLADSLNRRTLAIDRQVYGTTHPRIADSLVNLGEIQHDLGHDADAEKYYREALTIKKSWYGEVHPDTATCMAAVGQSLVYQGKYAGNSALHLSARTHIAPRHLRFVVSDSWSDGTGTLRKPRAEY